MAVAAQALSGNESPSERLETIHASIPQHQMHGIMSIGRRDSSSSVKSLRSYNTVRESLGKMHAYVERVSKLDSSQTNNH